MGRISIRGMPENPWTHVAKILHTGAVSKGPVLHTTIQNLLRSKVPSAKTLIGTRYAGINGIQYYEKVELDVLA